MCQWNVSSCQPRKDPTHYFSSCLSLLLVWLWLVAAASATHASEARVSTELLPREVRVGLYQNPPKIHYDDTGPAGIFVDILDVIADDHGWRLEYVPCDWARCLEMLEQGELDLMPDVAITPERQQRFDFHDEEVVSSWSALYAHPRHELGRISDLDGLRVAVLRDSVQQSVFSQMMDGFAYRVTLVEAESFADAFAEVAAQNADAVVTNHFFGDYVHSQYGLNKTPLVFNPASLYFATRADSNAELLQALDASLLRLKSEPNSAYYLALESAMERPPRTVVPGFLIWLLGFAVIGLIVLILFSFLLRWKVGMRTAELANANRLLEESQQTFRDLFFHDPAVKLLADPGNGMIFEANQAAEAFYGWSREQLCEMRIDEINALSEEQIALEKQRAHREQRVYLEGCHRLADGSKRDVAEFRSNLDVAGRPLEHLIIHDITEQKQLEKQLGQARKLESVGRLAGGVAHDYNNMLSVILGYTEMALAKTRPGDSLHNDLTEIHYAAERSAEITGQLLSFARKQQIRPRAIDLNHSIDRQLGILRHLLGENIKLQWQPDEKPCAVMFDPGQADQILANLCINARDAMPEEGGSVTISTKRVVLDEKWCDRHAEAQPGNYVELKISDDGSGMDNDTLENIFEPFFTTKGPGKGTGLGLPTVYGIVRQNNGFLDVSSEPGMGTVFRVFLPEHEGAVEPPEPETKEAGDDRQGVDKGHQPMVLAVDDEPAILRVISRTLSGQGYLVVCAESPQVALQLAREHGRKLDLLISDLVMPEMDGRALADEIHRQLPELPCLFVSGYSEEHLQDGRGAGDHCFFIQKPFSPAQLLENVASVLAGHG